MPAKNPNMCPICTGWMNADSPITPYMLQRVIHLYRKQITDLWDAEAAEPISDIPEAKDAL